jgi:ring-1,2-phenylacetyl-CoA epoxidase subunit PaaD
VVSSSVTLASVRSLVGAVLDPEIPVLTIADIGILRDVRLADGTLEVVITPTYSGCPAMRAIEIDIHVALARAGIEDARITTALVPPWTTDWLSPEAHDKLRRAGIAPPVASDPAVLFAAPEVACPQCRSKDTERLSAFASTACKALYRCRSCAEPFEYFKCL